MEEIEKALVALDARSRSNTKRLDKLENTADAIHQLATSVELMAQSMESMAKEQEKQGNRLAVLERLPAERWNTMTRTIFTSAVSTVAGGLVGALVTLLF